MHWLPRGLVGILVQISCGRPDAVVACRSSTCQSVTRVLRHARLEFPAYIISQVISFDRISFVRGHAITATVKHEENTWEVTMQLIDSRLRFLLHWDKTCSDHEQVS